VAENVLISLQITKAQDDELERLQLELKRSKSNLIREAINALIGTYRHDQNPASAKG
jgi:metal-responsive CopG/Arc/MetJ family transcriptional regulator